MQWTIHDIAREAGVSAKTVSRVINLEKGVAEETRAKVTRIIERVGYHPHTGARSMRSPNRDCIGVTLPAPLTAVPLSNTMLNWLFAELNRIFGSEGKYVCFDLNPYGAGNNRDYARGLWEQRYGGVIIAGVLPEGDPVVRRIYESGAPYLVTARMDTFPEISYAAIDIEEGAYISTRFLLNRGHKRVAMLKAFTGMQPGNARRRGYMRACEEAGVPFDRNLIRSTTFDARDIVHAVHRLLSDPTVTALVDSSGGEDAASIREGSLRAGRILGKDVEVVPWSYAYRATVLPEACAHVWQPLREAMIEGFEKLARWFDDELDGPVQVLYRPTLYEKGDTLGPPAPGPVFQVLT